ncbi:hypothetical protein MFIFM68171_01741 [Madurella fahalii]|uniref:Uncharacterized protein n=1 Tax=Madurella fahalii TaxID=1157608 RepID=A0ABQ0G196_9PEZI
MADSGDKGNPSGFDGQDPAGDASGSDVQDAQFAVSGKASDIGIVISSGEAAKRRRKKGNRDDKGSMDQDGKEKK